MDGFIGDEDTLLFEINLITSDDFEITTSLQDGLTVENS